jgi:hypothetical protein
MKRPAEDDRDGKVRGEGVRKLEWKQCPWCKCWFEVASCPKCVTGTAAPDPNSHNSNSQK